MKHREMFTSTIPLFLFSFLIRFIGGAVVHKPPEFQVLSPSDFNVILPPGQNGAKSVRIGINRQIGFGLDEPDFSRKNVEGRVVNFSGKDLNITKGDTIFYSMVFLDGEESFHGQTGNYVFDGVYKSQDRNKREVYEYPSEDLSSSEEVNQNPDTYFNTVGHTRRGRRLSHGFISPYHNFHHLHGPPSHRTPHHDAPPFPGPGSWNGQEHGHNGPWNRQEHEHSGPWNDRDEGTCEGKKEKKDNYPGRNQGTNHRRPWDNNDNPYRGNNDQNGSGFDSPYGDRKPSKGFSGDNPYNRDESSDNNSRNDTNNKKDNKTINNSNADLFTTRKPSTQRTTTSPGIDIRFKAPEEP